MKLNVKVGAGRMKVVMVVMVLMVVMVVMGKVKVYAQIRFCWLFYWVVLLLILCVFAVIVYIRCLLAISWL